MTSHTTRGRRESKQEQKRKKTPSPHQKNAAKLTTNTKTPQQEQIKHKIIIKLFEKFQSVRKPDHTT